MEPSSLALIAIVGVWAAYLVPHWVRRREQLTHSRAGDRHSSRLRLLVPRRRPRRSGHRSGGPVLASPRVLVDTDGQLLYVPGDRPVRARPAAPAVAPAASSEGAENVLTLAVAASGRAARRRARVLLLLGAALVSSVGIALGVPGAPGWVAGPMLALVVVHLLASRVAAVRSHENLTVLAAQLRTAESLATRRSRLPRPDARPAAAQPQPVGASARRPAAATGTWDPVPVPPPTYTLKPVVRRPEPPPLEQPLRQPLEQPSPAAAAWRAAVRPTGARGALPRRAEDVERILAMDDERPVACAVNQ